MKLQPCATRAPHKWCLLIALTFFLSAPAYAMDVAGAGDTSTTTPQAKKDDRLLGRSQLERLHAVGEGVFVETARGGKVYKVALNEDGELVFEQGLEPFSPDSKVNSTEAKHITADEATRILNGDDVTTVLAARDDAKIAKPTSSPVTKLEFGDEDKDGTDSDGVTAPTRTSLPPSPTPTGADDADTTGLTLEPAAAPAPASAIAADVTKPASASATAPEPTAADTTEPTSAPASPRAAAPAPASATATKPAPETTETSAPAPTSATAPELTAAELTAADATAADATKPASETTETPAPAPASATAPELTAADATAADTTKPAPETTETPAPAPASATAPDTPEPTPAEEAAETWTDATGDDVVCVSEDDKLVVQRVTSVGGASQYFPARVNDANTGIEVSGSEVTLDPVNLKVNGISTQQYLAAHKAGIVDALEFGPGDHDVRHVVTWITDEANPLVRSHFVELGGSWYKVHYRDTTKRWELFSNTAGDGFDVFTVDEVKGLDTAPAIDMAAVTAGNVLVADVGGKLRIAGGTQTAFWDANNLASDGSAAPCFRERADSGLRADDLEYLFALQDNGTTAVPATGPAPKTHWFNFSSWSNSRKTVAGAGTAVAALVLAMLGRLLSCQRVRELATKARTAISRDLNAQAADQRELEQLNRFDRFIVKSVRAFRAAGNDTAAFGKRTLQRFAQWFKKEQA